MRAGVEWRRYLFFVWNPACPDLPLSPQALEQEDRNSTEGQGWNRVPALASPIAPSGSEMTRIQILGSDSTWRLAHLLERPECGTP